MKLDLVGPVVLEKICQNFDGQRPMELLHGW